MPQADDEIDALGAALEIAARLEAGLDDMSATTVTLSRHEAILAFGMVNALIEALSKPRPH